MFQKGCELAMSNLKGSCNCGSAKYEVSGAVKKVVNCHCTLCRKVNGSAFLNQRAQGNRAMPESGVFCLLFCAVAKKYGRPAGTPSEKRQATNMNVGR
jgi:hypothetical protein